MNGAFPTRFVLCFTGVVCITAPATQNNGVTHPSVPAITSSDVSRAFSGSELVLPSDGEIQRFNILADRWKIETEDISSLTDMILHPAYFEIIGMGAAAIPLLLDELRKEPNHWFVALAAIAKVNPVAKQDAGSLMAMTRAWLDWGEKRFTA